MTWDLSDRVTYEALPPPYRTVDVFRYVSLSPPVELQSHEASRLAYRRFEDSPGQPIPRVDL